MKAKPRAGPLEYVSVLIALCLLGALYTSTMNAHGMFMWDEAEYASIGRALTEGRGYSIGGHANALRPPLMPLSASAAILVTGSVNDLALKFTVVLFALTGLALLYHSVRLAHGEGAGLLALILLGLFPSFWQHTSYFLAEVPFMAFFLGAVLYMHQGLYRDRRYFKYSWACFGLALLTRYTAVLFGPILLLMLVQAWLSRNEQGAVRSRIASGAFFLSPLLAATILAPWLVRQQLAFGDALVGFKEASGQLQAFAPEASMHWSFYLTHLPGMVTWIGLALVVVGIAWCVKSRDRLGWTCILTCLFLLAWFSIYRYKEVRLVTSILPFLAVLASLGAMQLARQFVPRLDIRSWGLVVGLALGANSYLVSKPFLTQSFTLGYPVLSDALDFIRDHSDRHDVVMSSLAPQVAWYTGLKTTHLPERDALATDLDRADWVLLVNFERGQPLYVSELTRKFTRQDVEDRNIHAFTSPRYQAYVIRAPELQKRL